MSKLVVISDPYPRTLNLIFNKEKFGLFTNILLSSTNLNAERLIPCLIPKIY